MSTKVADVSEFFAQEGESGWVSALWREWHLQRADKLAEWLEIRNYIFATDTTTTSAGELGWQNTTTTPKLCQIRDNLHSNYYSAIFPNDKWLFWEGGNKDSDTLQKAHTIQAYMTNKCERSGFKQTVSKALYDYIDYGNAFLTCEFVREFKEGEDGTPPVPSYIGPRAVRISPLDIAFNPLAEDFQHTPKILRSVKTLGDIHKLIDENLDEYDWKGFLAKREKLRQRCYDISSDDFNKICGYSADGFGDMRAYFQGDLVEILEFYGDYYDQKTGVLHKNKLITIADRNYTVRNIPFPSWFATAPIWHVGWRFRQDNLWAMGPLDNLVGMQYRIDHLENLKSDAIDLIVNPPLAIVGQIEQFVWGPGVEIQLDEGGSIQPLTRDMASIIQANNEIASLEAKMELYAGAPREAMGIRTPGEKTMFEVQQLANASGRIFQEKVDAFEESCMEPTLNGMLETSVRNMDGQEVLKVLDTDIGVELFSTITKEDITATGTIRPVGARHYAKQAQDLQNLLGMLNGPLGEVVKPHLSGKAAYKMIEDISGLQAYGLFSDFIAVAEQKELATQTNIAQEQFTHQNSAPIVNPGAPVPPK